MNRQYILRVPDDYHAGADKNLAQALVDPTIAGAICDRLVHNAQLLKLGGPSLRRKNAIPSEKTATQNPS